jgi:hypothetical protein
MFALLTVGCRAIRLARTNPVDSLRMEYWGEKIEMDN